MKLNVSMEKMVEHKLTPNHVFLLYLLHVQDFEMCKNLFGKELSIKLREDLLDTPFILSDKNTKFVETIISKDKVLKLLGLKGDNINFMEFYICYPIKVGSRVLRAKSENALLYQKHEKKYLSVVKTKEQHELAIKSITSYVAKQKQTDSLQFLPDIGTVINNAMWEKWEALIEESGKEGASWNSEEI